MGNWGDLETLEKIYWIIAIPSTAIFLIFLIISMFAGADADADMDADVDGEIGFQFISLKNLLGFFAVFAWSGLACIEAGMSNSATIIVSLLSGLAMMTIMATIFYFMSKLTDNGTLKMSNAVDHIGEVYLTIPAKRAGFGKVQIRVQGRLHELEAVTDSEEDINTGKLVVVKEVINNEILLVAENGK